MPPKTPAQTEKLQSRAKARDTGSVTEGWWFEGVMISGHGLAPVTRVLKHAAHDER